MGKFPLTHNSFEDGWSSDIKQGSGNSFSYSRHLDFRKSPSQLSILPATVKESGSIVTGLITEMIQLPSGLMVAIDSSGGVYTRSTAGTWAKNGTTLPDTAYGMIYNKQQDTIWISGQTALHNITNADGRFGGSFTVNSYAIFHQIDKSANVSTNTYTTLGAISEAAVDTLSFIPAIEPLYLLQLWVTTKGTGDLTVTMHDAANNVLATTTILNANITNGALNNFTLGPVRMLAAPNAATYHFHVTNPNGTASTIGCATVSDFSTARYAEWASRFVTPNNGFHPIYQFLQYYLILNERYVAQWEPISQSAPSASEFNQHRLVLPEGYEGTSACVIDEFFVIGGEKRSTSATNEFQQGKLFIWDGISPTYNRVINVPEGAPYALQSQGNVVFYFSNGKWWAWSTGNPVPLFQMPNTDFEFSNSNTYMVNYPHTMAVRNGILLGAFPSETNSTAIEHAVYSFGQRNKNYPMSFGFSYSPSHGVLTNGTLRLGMVRSFGDKLFLAWRNGSTYGVDKVDPNSPPFTTATWESLITDLQIITIRRRFPRPDVDKEAVYITAAFKPLPTGATITPKYKLDRQSNWVLGTPAVAGDTSVTFNINLRYKEAQIGLDFTATTVTPEVLLINFVIDSLPSEQD